MNAQALDAQKEAGQRVCPWWAACLFDNPFRRMVHPAEKVLGPYVCEGMSVLDFGCGFGHFSLGMARLTGKTGKVFAADIQQKMLDKTMGRARKAGLENIIHPLLCVDGRMGDLPDLDFALVCNSLHETRDPAAVLLALFTVLKPGARLFVMEPCGHIDEKSFETEVGLAEQTGFRETGRPQIWRERCVVFEKPGAL